MDSAFLFSALTSSPKIDETTGIISGVSVITIGEAAGKNAGTFIDSTTLSQIRRVAANYPDGVKVKLSQSKEHDGSAGQIVGVLRKFNLHGDQLLADLHLLKSDSNYAKIVEMSKTMPSEFGLSVVIPKELEDINGKKYLRCSEIYSVDIVEAPAANPRGLFSKQTNEIHMSKEIKYAKGESGEHAKDCECKECMSKHSKKEMSAHIATLLGLSAEATDAEIEAAFKAAQKPADVTALTKRLDDTQAELTRMKSSNDNQVALAKRTEIDSLMAEASKNAQVVPLENADLYTVKDGVCTIHMEPSQLSKVISRCPKGVVSLTRRPIGLPPKGADNKEIDRRSPEGKIAFAKWCQEKQQQGIETFSAKYRN